MISTRLPRFRAFTRFIASLAVALPLAWTNPGEAQISRQLPSPVAATQFESMLRDAGFGESLKDVALPLHEAYFERFRDFEKREVDPIVEAAAKLPVFGQSIEDAKRDAENRRRVFQRAGQLDDQLVDELTALLPAPDAWRSGRVRMALARRRCASLTPMMGMQAKALDFTLRSAPVLSQIDADNVNIIQTALDAYEAELTRLLSRYAEAAFARIVRSAELREEMGIGNGPALGENGAAPDPEQLRAQFEQMAELRRRAGEETTAASARIRKHHRDGLDQVLPFMRPDEAWRMRDYMMSALYPLIRTKSEFASVFETARKMRSDGDLDRTTWESVQSLAGTYELSARALLMELMALSDARMAESAPEGFLIGVGGEQEESPEEKKANRIKEDLAALDERDTAALRTILGLPQPEPKRQVAVERQGIDLAQVLGGEVQIEGSAIMIGASGGGEMVVLSGDDLADGMMFNPFGGGNSRIPRPMNRDELDALATATGFAGDARAVFDEIVARAAEARNTAEKEHAPPAPSFESSEGGMSFTIQLSGDGGEIMGGGDSTALFDAIDTLEEQLFDELRAVAAADRAESVEAARRARARMRLLPGESGEQAVDLVDVAKVAALAEAAQSRIANELRAWDESSVPTIRSMRSEVATFEAERMKLFEQATTETVQEGSNGDTQVARAIALEGDTMERMEKVDRGIAQARARVADLNRRTYELMSALLEGDAASQTALRRAFLRAANPSSYRLPRDLEPFFTKATAIVGESESGKTAAAALRAEWIEAREARLEAYLAEKSAGGTASLGGDSPEAGMRRMQLDMRERKKLREDLEQLEATIFRRLQELLLTEVGADKAAELGELPKKRRGMPMIQFGG